MKANHTDPRGDWKNDNGGSVFVYQTVRADTLHGTSLHHYFRDLSEPIKGPLLNKCFGVQVRAAIRFGKWKLFTGAHEKDDLWTKPPSRLWKGAKVSPTERQA